MSLMIRIGKSFQVFFVPRTTTHVLRRSAASPVQTSRIPDASVRWKNRLQSKSVLPSVSEIVEVIELATDLPDDRLQFHPAFIERLAIIKILRIVDFVPLISHSELVQMVILPGHNHLNYKM